MHRVSPHIAQVLNISVQPGQYRYIAAKPGRNAAPLPVFIEGVSASLRVRYRRVVCCHLCDTIKWSRVRSLPMCDVLDKPVPETVVRDLIASAGLPTEAERRRH